MICFDGYSGESPVQGTRAVPIARQTFIVSGPIDNVNTSWTRTAFPIKLSYSITIHKSQSLTLDKIVIDVKNFPWAFSNKLFTLFFVAVSRTSKLDNILFMHNIHPFMVSSKKSEYINIRLEEEKRLDGLSLATMARFGFDRC